MASKIILKIKAAVKKIPFAINIKSGLLTSVLLITSFYKWRRLYQLGEIKLELGSGAKKGTNGYVTVDVVGADIYRDLRDGIPLRDNTVSAIYTSHLLEHIPFQQLIVFLKECHRVLKPNGVLSICVPNARNYIQAYTEGRQFHNDVASYAKEGLVSTGSFLDQVNYIAYMGGQHCYLFDEENLLNTLKLAGFDTSCLRLFDSEIDNIERDFESIYALGIK
jgi:predicted SAM-dependent methyltransferase